MELLVNDTETCGLNPPAAPASGVVEVAWAVIHPVTLEILDEGASLVNPGCPIAPEASAINGIYDKDVADAPPLSQVFQRKEPTVSIGHNTQFDLKFLGGCYDNLVGSLCTLALARQYIKDSPNHKLATLAKHLGLDPGRSHRALSDVYTTIGLLRHIVELTGRSVEQHIAAARKPKLVHAMPFGKYRGTLIGHLPMWYIEYFDGKEIDQDLRYSFDQQKKLRGAA